MANKMLKKNSFTALAIETSCDETAMAVIQSEKTTSGWKFDVLSNVVASQIDIHKKWGGVYPELASRAHLEAMIPVLREALSPLGEISNNKLLISSKNLNAKFPKEKINMAMQKVDVIAVTEKPGLIGSLLMGIETAQILGTMFDKPIINVNHLEGHIYASFAGKIPNNKFLISNKIPNPKIKIENLKFKIPKTGIFPVLALVVSGGHTSLILMKDHLEYETVAQTIDDAAGEAFDKVARIIGLPYPGGPEIEKLAKKGNQNAYQFTVGMNGKSDFSFSGLKTAVLYLTKDVKTGRARKYNKADLAASFQKIVADTLIQKTQIAVRQYEPKTLILSGGVSANAYIRKRFQDVFSQSTTGCQQPTILIPPKTLSTDNAVGIGLAGIIKLAKQRF